MELMQHSDDKVIKMIYKIKTIDKKWYFKENFGFKIALSLKIIDPKVSHL